jgi:hypothetical protein
MFKNVLTSLLFLCFTLKAGIALGSHSKHDCDDVICRNLSNFAVLSNQVTVNDGDTIPWSPASSGSTSAGITVNSKGHIKFHNPGLFLVQYTED